MSATLKRLTRLRMSETGQKYTACLRAITAMDEESFAALRERDEQMRRRQRYPVTDRDGLPSWHVLSAMETSRSRH
jgi:hypothetical protein